MSDDTTRAAGRTRRRRAEIATTLWRRAGLESSTQTRSLAMVEKPRPAAEVTKRPRKKPPARAKAPQVRYGAQIAAEICERLAKGEPWATICTFEGMPSYTTLYAWQDKDPAFAEAVARARLQGAGACADEALSVARAATKETALQARMPAATPMRLAA